MSVLSRSTLITNNTNKLATNGTNAITATVLRDHMKDFIDSSVLTGETYSKNDIDDLFSDYWTKTEVAIQINTATGNTYSKTDIDTTIANLTINDLNDVDISGASNGQVLMLSGSSWVNKTIIIDTPISPVADAMIYWDPATGYECDSEILRSGATLTIQKEVIVDDLTIKDTRISINDGLTEYPTYMGFDFFRALPTVQCNLIINSDGDLTYGKDGNGDYSNLEYVAIVADGTPTGPVFWNNTSKKLESNVTFTDYIITASNINLTATTDFRIDSPNGVYFNYGDVNNESLISSNGYYFYAGSENSYIRHNQSVGFEVYENGSSGKGISLKSLYGAFSVTGESCYFWTDNQNFKIEPNVYANYNFGGSDWALNWNTYCYVRGTNTSGLEINLENTFDVDVYGNIDFTTTNNGTIAFNSAGDTTLNSTANINLTCNSLLINSSPCLTGTVSGLTFTNGILTSGF